MPEPMNQFPNMRERKKERTRRALVDAAVDLCIRQGYEDTTVEQIAAAADVSPRTFSRYFATKDTVFIAVIDQLADEITGELTSQPPALPMEALRAALIAVLTRVADRPVSGLTMERFMLILRVVYSSPVLRQSAIDYRSEPAMTALARHMGVAPDDPKLDLAVSLFTTTVVSACSGLLDGNVDVPLGPEDVMTRLSVALRQVVELTAELRLPSP